MMTLNRISVNPRVCHGKPVIRGTRIMVWQVLDLLQSGLSFDDIQACLQYANAVIKHEEVRLTGATKSGRLSRR